MKKCKSCGNICAEDAKFCNECGYKFEEVVETVVEEVVEAVVEEEKIEEVINEDALKYVECPICGATVDVSDNTNCPVCGALLVKNNQVERNVDKKVYTDKKQNKKSGLAVASFIIAIVNSLLSISFINGGVGFLALIFGMLSIVFSIVALCKKVKGKAMVFAIIGLALTAEALLTCAIYPIIEEIMYELEEEFYLFIK